jgi:hypothetical protein
MPRYPSAAHDFVDHQGLHVPLQSSFTASHKTNQPTPFPMDVQVAIPTSVAVSQLANIAFVVAMKVSPSRRFFRATRGRQKSTTVVVENVGMQDLSTGDCVVSTSSHLEILEECPVGPPPHA